MLEYHTLYYRPTRLFKRIQFYITNNNIYINMMMTMFMLLLQMIIIVTM